MNCRLCDHAVLDKLLSLDGFPKAAQYFPDVSEFDEDKGITLEVVQCQCCGLIQLSNDPVDYYKEVITAASMSQESKARLISRLQPIIKRHDLVGKNALEVGCGTGEAVLVMKEMGLNALGLEYSTKNINKAKKRNIPVTQGYIEDYTCEQKNDFFICLNYLEHQPRPRIFLKSINRNLNQTGLGYITVPNFEFLIGNSALHEFVADHLVYFTEETLRTTLEISGFRVLESALINNDNDISVVVSKKSPLLMTDHMKELVNKKTKLKEFVEKVSSDGKRLAIWGAGHRALALMSLSNLREITAIIDSAPFKQGHFSPLLHKEIISPKDIDRYKIEVILVMLPGDYASEVQVFIKNNHKNIELYVFDEIKIDKVCMADVDQ